MTSPKQCSVKYCYKEYYALGLCSKHYYQRQEYKDKQMINHKILDSKRKELNKILTVEDYKRMDWTVEFNPITFTE